MALKIKKGLIFLCLLWISEGVAQRSVIFQALDVYDGGLVFSIDNATITDGMKDMYVKNESLYPFSGYLIIQHGAFFYPHNSAPFIIGGVSVVAASVFAGSHSGVYYLGAYTIPSGQSIQIKVGIRAGDGMTILPLEWSSSSSMPERFRAFKLWVADNSSYNNPVLIDSQNIIYRGHN